MQKCDPIRPCEDSQFIIEYPIIRNWAQKQFHTSKVTNAIYGVTRILSILSPYFHNQPLYISRSKWQHQQQLQLTERSRAGISDACPEAEMMTGVVMFAVVSLFDKQFHPL